MNILKLMGEALVEVGKVNKVSLKENPLRFSDLFLTLDNDDHYILEFEVLGQNFNLNKQGLFTFNEMGIAYSLEKEFAENIYKFLLWRLTTIKNFEV